MKKIYITFLLVSLHLVALAQDALMSQFNDENLNRNPGLAGIFRGDFVVNAIYRNQWAYLNSPINTAYIQAQNKILIKDGLKDFFTLGFNASKDVAGSLSLQNTYANASLTFNKSIESEHATYISLGFTGGAVQQSFDPTKIRSNNQFSNGAFDGSLDPKEFVFTNKINFNTLAAGVSISGGLGRENNTKYYIGVAAFNLNRPKTSYFNDAYVRKAIRYSFNAGLRFTLSNAWSLAFTGNYSTQNPFEETIGGASITWRQPSVMPGAYFAFTMGSYYRLNDAIIGLLRIDYKNYNLTCTYDIPNPQVSKWVSNAGAFEVGVGYKGFKSRFNNQILCPGFEDNDLNN